MELVRISVENESGNGHHHSHNRDTSPPVDRKISSGAHERREGGYNYDYYESSKRDQHESSGASTYKASGDNFFLI